MPHPVHYLKKIKNHMPLWAQLLIMSALVTACLLTMILVRDYQNNRASIIDRQISTSDRLLEMEMQNLEQYIRELASFCLQPLYDTELSRILSEKTALGSSDETYLLNQMRTYYYTRTDITAYQICLLPQDTVYGRSRQAQHFRRMGSSPAEDTPRFRQSFLGKYFHAIAPSGDESTFLEYYHSIIRIKNKEASAVVKVETDLSFAENLNRSHKKNGEFLCILNQAGELLYCGLPSLASTEPQPEELTKELTESIQAIPTGGSEVLTLKGQKYLCVSHSGEKYGLQLVSFCPYTAISRELSYVLKSNLLFGIVAWLIAAAATFLIIRLTMAPLSSLRRSMKEVGSGNFSPIEEIGGSQEILELSAGFNEMVHHIRELIDKNYISEINEKTARLTALEAQLNPHFLYNTLQAIATEALINDQPQINRMITSLAAGLRYTIKGGDSVRLEDELSYVKGYILLQKIRFEDRLQVELDIDEACFNEQIPKISIQTLVENSIIHGLGNLDGSISITVRAFRQDGFLIITVDDDGCGISESQLSQIRQGFRDCLKPESAGKIGLANLYSRLQLLYQGKADLEIQSELRKGTRITLRIPVVEETS